MKKSILALAIASASLAGVAQANNTTLYGSVRMAVEVTDDGDTTSSHVRNNSSRWGIRGTDEIGNGLDVFYRYEFAVQADTNGGGQSNRLGFVGLKGGFGSVALGSQWSPYYNIVGYNDIFNGSFSYDRTYLGAFRISNSLIYTTPEMGGFKAQVALIHNGLGGNDDHVDAYNIGLSYANAGIFAGLTYFSTNGLDDETSLVGAAAGYSNDAFRIGLAAEYGDDGSDANPLNLSLAGEYYLSDADTLRAIFEVLDTDTDADEQVHVALGYQHNFSKRSRVWAEYSYFDEGDNADELQVLSLGIRTDF
ncbi:porin [Ostreibacterium oceani]|uniref:Porin n=1 Tax=Ostreibacterium oceani TaxID=2654998 RepID=A0A6N7ET76_9GAMM|nr:porin [Ostreibacterium oceani]MPV85642.1 porin [Ostreibacterium oceani]